jgi:glutamine amidotransferase PdxT
MTNIQIERFFSQQKSVETPVKISFKKRSAITGIFIQTPDFEELKAKNFWRIVAEADLAQWKISRDHRLCRMFNGIEFTKLAVAV